MTMVIQMTTCKTTTTTTTCSIQECDSWRVRFTLSIVCFCFICYLLPRHRFTTHYSPLILLMMLQLLQIDLGRHSCFSTCACAAPHDLTRFRTNNLQFTFFSVVCSFNFLLVFCVCWQHHPYYSTQYNLQHVTSHKIHETFRFLTLPNCQNG